MLTGHVWTMQRCEAAPASALPHSASVRQTWKSAVPHEGRHVVEWGPSCSGWQQTPPEQSAASSHDTLMVHAPLLLGRHVPPSVSAQQNWVVLLHDALPHDIKPGSLGAPPSGTGMMA